MNDTSDPTTRCAYVYPHNRPSEKRWKGDVCGRPLSDGNASGLCMKHAPVGFSRSSHARHITLNREKWEKARRPY